MKEIWRRLFLLAGVSLAVCMWLYADLSPRVTVEPVHFAKEQKNLTHFMGVASERRRYLASLPLETYIRKMLDGNEVGWNPKWKAFAVRVEGELKNPRLREEQKGWGSDPRLWFKLRAPPFRDLAPRFMSSPHHALYLSYKKNGKLSYLRFQLHTYQKDDFALGSGYRDAWKPPAHNFYPLRAWAWLPVLLGLLGYLLIPWRGKEDGKIHVSKPTVVFGDIVSLGLFTLFFSLPFFICGAIQPAGCWGIPALFSWPFALIWVWLLRLSAEYGSFTVRLIPGGFRLRSLSFSGDVFYDQLEKVSPAVLRNPRWLRILTGLAALFSQGADQARLAGQSLLLSSASYGGLHFRFKDGRAFYFWCRDQRGNLIFKGLPQLLEQVSVAGLLDESKIVEKRGVAMDIVTRASSGRGSADRVKRSFRPMLLLSGAPLCIVMAFLLLGKGMEARGNALLAKRAPVRSPTKVAKKVIPRPKPPVPPVKRVGVVWQKTVGGGQIVAGEYVIHAGDGGSLVVGESFRGRSDILLVRLDGHGNILWKKTYGGPGDERPAGVAATKDGSFIVVGTQGPTLFRNVYLFKVDGKGKVLWERTWGKKYEDEVAGAMVLKKDGTFAVIVYIKYTPTLLIFSADGRPLSRKRLTTGLPDERALSAKGFLSLPDGSFVVCGTLERTGAGFQDAYLMKLDSRGNRAWVKTYGGEGKEGVGKLRWMPDGGYLMTGFKGFSESGTQDTWLIRTNAKGKTLWKKTLKGQDGDIGGKIFALPGGESLILCSSTLKGIDARGKVLWQKGFPRKLGIYSLVLDGAGTAVVTGKRSIKDKNWFRSDLIVMKIRLN